MFLFVCLFAWRAERHKKNDSIHSKSEPTFSMFIIIRFAFWFSYSQFSFFQRFLLVSSLCRTHWNYCCTASVMFQFFSSEFFFSHSHKYFSLKLVLFLLNIKSTQHTLHELVCTLFAFVHVYRMLNTGTGAGTDIHITNKQNMIHDTVNGLRIERHKKTSDLIDF